MAISPKPFVAREIDLKASRAAVQRPSEPSQGSKDPLRSSELRRSFNGITRCKLPAPFSPARTEKPARKRSPATFRFQASWLSLILVVFSMLIGPAHSQTYHLAPRGSATFPGVMTFMGFFHDQEDKTVAEGVWGVAQVSQDATLNVFSAQVYEVSFDDSSPTVVGQLADSYYTIVIGPRLFNNILMHTASKSLLQMKPVVGNPSQIIVAKHEKSTGTYDTNFESTNFPVAAAPLFFLDIQDPSYALIFCKGTSTVGNGVRFVNVGATGQSPTVGSLVELTPGIKMSTFYDLLAFKHEGHSHIFYNGYFDPYNTYTYIFQLAPASNQVTLKAAWSNGLLGITLSIADNLNGQDYIYANLVSNQFLGGRDVDFYLAAFKISDVIAAQQGATLQTGDIFSAFGSKLANHDTFYKLLNAGTFNYVLAAQNLPTAIVKLFPKDYRNFGSNAIAFRLPAAMPQTSATYAYGFFRTSSSEDYSFYYQQAYGTDPLRKAQFVECSAATPYFKTDTETCISAAAALALTGYIRDDAYFELSACAVSNCDTCPDSAATCTKCKAGFSLVGNACVECSVNRCTQCSTVNTCASCQSPYTGSDCLSCVSGYLKNTGTGQCVSCSMLDCVKCSTDGVCSECKNSKVPSFDGKLCLLPEASCQPLIPQCASCNSTATCKTCNTDYRLSDDAKSCAAIECNIDNCLKCDVSNRCASCEAGLFLAVDGSSCDLLDVPIANQTYADFDAESQKAFVQVDHDAADFDFSAFSYILVDLITGKKYACPQCSAELVPEFSKSLRFKIVSDVEILSGTLQVSFPTSSVKSRGKKLLQSTSEYGLLKVDNIRLPGAGRNNDKIAYRAFTGINAIRFFATIFLGLFNTPHAFWSTYQFSWLQLWALLPGKFLSYPDRLLNWHYKWYLLVIDFGDPFKNWKDWNFDGAKCFAQNEYPTSRLGCGFVDNFGQNFIIIFCVLAFCLLVSSIMVVDWWRRRRQSSMGNDRDARQGRRFFRSTTQLEKSVSNKYFAQIYLGLGFPYFFRFMDAIQPSLVYFSMLQFDTYVSSTNIGVSVFFAVVFFVYYLLTTSISFLLARKVWSHLSENSEEEITDLGRVALKVGGMFRFFSFQFNGYKRVDAFWKLLTPVIEWARVMLICIFMITVKAHPKTALGLVLVVEAVRLVFVALMHKYRISVLYALEDYTVTGFFLLYLVLKLASNDSYTESTIQNQFGWAMAFFLSVIWGCILLDVVIDTYILIKNLLSSKRKSKQQADSPAGSNKVDVLALYTEPENVGDGDNESPDARGRQIPISSGRRGDFNEHEMNEAWFQRSQFPDNFQPAPMSSNRRGNYDSRDMNEKGFYSVPLTSGRKANYDSVDMRERQNGQVPMVDDGGEGYDSRDMSEGYMGTSPVQSQGISQQPQNISANKIANFDSREMSEGYMGTSPAQSQGISQQPQNISANRVANFDSREMSEGYQSESHKSKSRRDNNFAVYQMRTEYDHFDPSQGQLGVGIDGYLSKDMNEKTAKPNRENSKVLETNMSQEHSKTGASQPKKVAKSGILQKSRSSKPPTHPRPIVQERIQNADDREYQMPPAYATRGEGYDSRDMSEGYMGTSPVQSQGISQQPQNISAYRAANFASRDMSEGYMGTSPVQSQGISQQPQNISANRVANFDSREMSEGNQSESHKSRSRRDNNFAVYQMRTEYDHFDPSQGQLGVGIDGYLSKDMNEKTAKPNRENSKVLETNMSQQGSLSGTNLPRKAVLEKQHSFLNNSIPQVNYVIQSISERKDDNYDSRDMEEEY